MVVVGLVWFNFSLHVYSPEQRQTPQGQIYFIHLTTGMSTWHDPRFRGIEIPEEDLGPLGEAWEVRYTDHNRKYFVDHINGTTQFTGE